MGIRYLNSLIKSQCKDSIKHMDMNQLVGKIIAVDISIYLYKYEITNSLLENIYLMLATFRHYNIIPVFIFDGKTPPEKNELIKKRKYDKIVAKKDYEILNDKIQCNNNNIHKDEMIEIIAEMNKLKKEFIYIGRNKIENVKQLIRAYGATYYDAHGEADELCAMLVIQNKAWACLSEDMDYFAYGCPRVIRSFCLTKHNVTVYYMDSILNKLNMTQTEFRNICVISGTDYNHNINVTRQINLYEIVKQFRKYKNEQNEQNEQISFYQWLTNLNYILDHEFLIKINKIFDIYYNHNLSIFKKIMIINGNINQQLVKEIMSTVDFIFLE